MPRYVVKGHVPLGRYELFGVNRDNYLERIRDGMPLDKRFALGKMPVQYVPREQ